MYNLEHTKRILKPKAQNNYDRLNYKRFTPSSEERTT